MYSLLAPGGVQSQWVGTTWFRSLVQKDSCFEFGQVRYVLGVGDGVNATLLSDTL